MKKESYDQGIKLIKETFGDIAIAGSKIFRIREICEGQIDDHGFIHICQYLCDTNRYPPLPVDFKKAVDEWRKSYYYANGKNYREFGAQEATEFSIPPCKLCFDTGLFKISHHDDQKFKKLIRCTCSYGKNCSAQMPQWDNALSGAFAKGPLDPEWFNPRIGFNEKDSKMLSKIMKKVEEWKIIVKASEKYWADMAVKNA